jgi:hypothetical protein
VKRQRPERPGREHQSIASQEYWGVLYLPYPADRLYDMTGPLEHVWGVSAAKDRVWAQVSGLPPSKAGKRLFLVLQAFVDYSYNPNGVFVLAGYIASAEAWADFSKEWEAMLPFGTLNQRNRYHFKMAEMAMTDERMERVPAFFRIIENHILGYVSCKIDISELRNIRFRLQVPGTVIDWGMFGNPYLVAFRCLLDMFHLHRAKMQLLSNEKIDFYFDNQSEKGVIISMWDDYIARRPDETRQYYGATPRFEDDEEFLPLQAADFWAWWVRKWYAEGVPERIRSCDFGRFKAKRKRKLSKMWISFNQDQLVTTMKRILRSEIGPDRPIYEFL